MKRKNVLFICAVLLLTLTIALGILPPAQADAAAYGSSLFTAQSGSVDVISSLEGGLHIKFNKSSADSDAKYTQLVDMKLFELTFAFTEGTANFESMVFRFTDEDNSTRWVEVWFRKWTVAGTPVIQYRLIDNFNNKTDFKEIPDFGPGLFETGMMLGYENGVFYVTNGENNAAHKNLEHGGVIKTTDFYKSISRLVLGVRGVDGGEDSVDAVLVLKSWKNSLLKGEYTQQLDSKHESYNEFSPAVIREKDGDAANDIETFYETPDNDPLKGPYKYSYKFPYYCISILGKGWSVETKAPGAESDFGSKVSGKTEHALSEKSENFNAGQGYYEFKIYASEKDNQPRLHLKVLSKEDKRKPEMDDAALEEYIKKLADPEANGLAFGKFPALNLEAPKNGNTYAFPRITASAGQDFKILVDDTDEIDTYSTVKFEIGYKKPGYEGKWVWAGSCDVQLNAVGQWWFKYRATDLAGNVYESKYVFSRYVQNHEPPIFDMNESISQDYTDKVYTPGSATVSGNAGVGLNYDKNEFRVYYYDAAIESGAKNGIAEAYWAGGREVEYEDKEIKSFYFDESLKEGTPEGQDASYVIVYFAEDTTAPQSYSSKYAVKLVITVPEELPKDPNPANDVLEVILIIVACISGLGLIVLIFMNPVDFSKRKKAKVKTGGAYADDDEGAKDTGAEE